jgi:hypothetical protein
MSLFSEISSLVNSSVYMEKITVGAAKPAVPDKPGIGQNVREARTKCPMLAKIFRQPILPVTPKIFGCMPRTVPPAGPSQFLRINRSFCGGPGRNTGPARTNRACFAFRQGWKSDTPPSIQQGHIGDGVVSTEPWM